MPPRVDFYVTEDSGEAARLRLDCRVAEKAWLARQRVDFIVEDQRQAGDAQHQQKKRADQAGPFMDEIPGADGATCHYEAARFC